MAGVDHAYQYSVEVKSRFSLFLDDSLNNEDPQILLSKLQTKKTEKGKKDKIPSSPPAKPDKFVEVEKPEAKPDVNLTKVKQPVAQPEVVPEAKNAEEINTQNNFRFRGSPRGGPRMPRGARGQPRAFNAENQVNNVNRMNDGRPRGRGRGGREFFGRGRGNSFSDKRDSVQPEATIIDSDENNAVALPESEVPNKEVSEDEQTEKPDDNETVDPVETQKEKLTLKEYKAMQMTSKPTVVVNAKETRKPNDGKDVFTDMVAHRKIPVHVDEAEEKENKPEVKEEIDVEFGFKDEFGGRGRFGQDRSRSTNYRGSGRGRPSGRGIGSRGRGFNRPAENTIPPPSINNDQEFPSLK